MENTLASTFLGAGFKTTGSQWIQPKEVLRPKVMGNHDYHIYTGGWFVKRFPIHIFKLFHSMFWYPKGPNYVTGFDRNGNPNYPDVDDAAAAIWYASNIGDAQAASKLFCWLHVNYCINIPLWSTSSFVIYRKGLAGAVNMDGYGLINPYTKLNAYRAGGGPIRIGVINEPQGLNILYSSWIYDYIFLDCVYTTALSIQPYNLAIDQPWVVQDWESGTWIDQQDGHEKSVTTYYIRKDVGIAAPATGAFVRNFSAHDFEFTIWYVYAHSDCWHWSSVMDIKYTRIVDVNGDGWDELQVYFDDFSLWFYGTVGFQLPLLTKDELIDPLCAQTTETWAQTGTTSHLLANNVVQVVGATLTTDQGIGILIEGVDYIIKAGYDLYSHIEFYPLHDLTGNITITYWYADIPGTGFYLAGLPWQTTMYSLGTHYPVSMTNDPPGIGDTIVLKSNPAFFLEKPLLGELDWAWKWVGAVKPRSGYYKIEIFDVVRATGAYCTRGDGLFNPTFFTGADLDSSDLCHIGIFDLVTITGKYAKTFGTPPP